jgi:hypothetical protein
MIDVRDDAEVADDRLRRAGGLGRGQLIRLLRRW